MNIFEFIIVCISVFCANFGSQKHANSKRHFYLITIYSIFVDDSLPGFLDADTFEEGKLLKSHVFPSLNVLSQEQVAT